MSALCRSCEAPIIWAVTENGRKIPLDAEPAERPSGLFTLSPNPDQPSAPLAVSAAKQLVYLSHFVTCPNASQHRRSAA